MKIRLRLDNEVFDWLHAEAARLKVDVSTIVRRALRGERRSATLVTSPAEDKRRNKAKRVRPSHKARRRGRARR